jgi:hypothetical protein
MATPTGYKFLDGGVQKDFADVFNITNPVPGVSTGYKSDLAPYSGKDLGEIFTPGNSGKTTHYFDQSANDLGSIFAIKNPWSALGTGLSYLNGALVSTIAIDAYDNVYVGGTFLTAGGTIVNNIAKWDGTTWFALTDSGGTGVTTTAPYASVLCIVIDASNNVYISGSFTTAGITPALNVAKWDGTSWSAFGTGVTGSIYTIAIDTSNNLYVGGTLAFYSGNVAKWNGTSWSAFGTLTGGTVNTIKISSSGTIYAGGAFTSPATLLAQWNGTAWAAVSTGINGYFVKTIYTTSAANVLYVGGQFNSIGGGSYSPGPNVAYFNGSSWNYIGTVNGPVYSINSGSADMYFGGKFSNAGGVAVTNVARYNTITLTWFDVSGGVSGAVMTVSPEADAIAIDSSYHVYVGGLFANANSGASSIIVNSMAKYTPP